MKISLITVTYNSAGTLADTLESVLAQTYKNVEYLIIDGNSKDATIDILRDYEARFGGRMQWLSETDGGIYDAMNKGISRATGDVVGILNSDDFFASAEVLEKVAAVMDSDSSIDGVYGDVRYVDPEDTSRTVRHYSSASFSRKKLVYGLMPAHPSFYVRRACYLKYGLYDTRYRISADYDLFVRLVWKGGLRLCYLPFDFVDMRNGGASSSGLQVHRRIMREHLQIAREGGLPSSFFLQSLRYFGKIMDLIRK